MRGAKTLGLAALGVGAAALAERSRHRIDLGGRNVLVTGATAGLGLALARRLVQSGAQVAICGRDADTVERAAEDLSGSGPPVLGQVCDVADPTDVARLIEEVDRELGGIEVLVNNAGVIDLGEVTSDAGEVFRELLDVMFWGTVHPTLAVLPRMRERGFGRIVNVTSIGARVSAPHLVAYSCAKHAAYAFSQGLRAETAGEGIRVTTVVPGLMHTGSHRAARVQGANRAEFAWFALAGAGRLTSTAPERAADRIVRALRSGTPHTFIGLDARVGARVEALAPGLTARALGVVQRGLPDTRSKSSLRAPGWQTESWLTRSALTAAGREAAARLQRHRPGVAEGIHD